VDELEEWIDATYETVKADVAFHHLMCSRCGHELLLDAFKSLQSLTWLFVFNTQLYQSDLYSDEPSHFDMFEAIASGDPDRAAETVREHIEAAGGRAAGAHGGAGSGTPESVDPHLARQVQDV